MGLFDAANELMGGALPAADLRKLRQVVDVVWEHREELVNLVVHLPSVLADTGEQLQVAGAGAKQASEVLGGDLLTLTDSAADILDASQRQLAVVAAVLGEVGKVLDRMPLMGPVKDPVSRGLGAVGQVAANLETVAHQVRGIGVGLAGVGVGLEAMGASLEGGGAALVTLSGRNLGAANASKRLAQLGVGARGAATPADRAATLATTQAPAREAPAKKAAAKKAPAKKAPAKKAAAKKAPAKKAAAKKAPAKKAPAKKAARRSS